MPLARQRLVGGTGLDRHPLAAALGALAVAAAGRTLEVLLGVHEAVGSPAVSPILALLGGFLAYRAAGRPGAGFARDRAALARALAVGGLAVLAVQAVAHGLEVATLALAGGDPVLAIEGVSPSTKSIAPAHVGAYLLLGVLLTALGEELLFRGALLGTLTERVGFWRANAAQAGLFGAWHLAWPLAVALGPFEPPVPMAVYALGFVVVPAFVGGVLGVLVRATGTLWTAVIAHAVHNGVAVFVHVRADGGVQVSVLSAGLVVGYAVLAWWTWWRWLDRSPGLTLSARR